MACDPYHGDAAARGMVALAETTHGTNAAKVVEFLSSEAHALADIGDDAEAMSHLSRRDRAALGRSSRAVSDDERGAAYTNLGNALGTLGERESGTARLEEAVQAYRAALEERTRERGPLDWAGVQNNLGNALQALGKRESGTGRSRKRSRPIARRFRNGRASVFRSNGQ